MMTTPGRLLRQAILTAFLGLTALAAAPAEPPPPTDPEESRKLAASLAHAADDETRDRLLAAAPSALARDARTKHAFYVETIAVLNHGDFTPTETLIRYLRRWSEKDVSAAGTNLAEWISVQMEVYRQNDHDILPRIMACRRFFETSGDRHEVGGTLHMEAVVYLHQGDYRRALEASRREYADELQAHDKEGTLAVLCTMANIFGDQGQYDRAVDHMHQALTLAGDDPYWDEALFGNLATVYSLQHDFERAAAYAEKSARLAEKQGNQPTLGVDLESLAEFQREAGHLDQAEENSQRALAIAKSSGDKPQQAGCLNNLAEIALARGDAALRPGLALAQAASALAHESGAPNPIRTSCTILGKLHRALQQPSEARAAFQEAIDATEDARGHLTGGDEDAAAFLADKLQSYRQMVTLLADTGQPAQALAMAERAKARALVEILRSPKLDPAKVMTAVERDAAQAHAQEIAALNRQIVAAHASQPPAPPAQLAALDEKLAAARRARDDAEADFFRAHPELRNRQGPDNTDAALPDAALDGLLADGKTALLEYVVNDGETLLFTVTKSGDSPPQVRAQKLPLGRATLTARTRAFRASLAERSLDWQTDARALGDDLLAAAWPTCAGAERFVIVPDGSLWELPFQALTVPPEKPSGPSRTLWEARVVSFAPSLTFLTQSSRASTAPAHPAKLLAVGNPALSKEPAAVTRTAQPAEVLLGDETTPLPDAERQVRALADLYGSGRSRVLVGADADEDEFKRNAGDYDVIHFATHGFLNDTAPMYSRLLMSQRNLAPDEDGFLEAWEWLPLRLRARLAVLSACETGRGRVGDGEGLLGFSWALFSAGCPAAVVSQWKVDSASTSELMIGLHRQLLQGVAPSRALRMAGLELARNPKYRHPFYWAPFVLVGAEQSIASP